MPVVCRQSDACKRYPSQLIFASCADIMCSSFLFSVPTLTSALLTFPELSLSLCVQGVGPRAFYRSRAVWSGPLYAYLRYGLRPPADGEWPPADGEWPPPVSDDMHLIFPISAYPKDFVSAMVL